MVGIEIELIVQDIMIRTKSIGRHKPEATGHPIQEATEIVTLSSEDGSRLSFHTFPLKNASRLKAWVHACGRQNFTPTKSDRVCSLHFDSGDFERDLQLELLGHDPKKRQRARKLKPESVPRLPEHHPGAIESKSSKTREHSIRRAERAAHQEALREILEASQAQASSEAGVGNEEAGEAISMSQDMQIPSTSYSHTDETDKIQQSLLVDGRTLVGGDHVPFQLIFHILHHCQPKTKRPPLSRIQICARHHGISVS
ncbi:hypothetical protein CAPTEDRAFT_210621 [Capitella teleta]|uniref:THAP-type domain-containing protein n=1 Tax=Capitella teleta TaxID=283909 RepID=R7UYI6_CAPTE|nr:hypothetical protein CAPTEDRAFT_210621 [Capitella teleta]|eukprot:ELU11337.1 hypothetical protein CAPTEDRAFT_210621 [Capitella teleta]